VFAAGASAVCGAFAVMHPFKVRDIEVQ
jgi:hypothetical protein